MPSRLSFQLHTNYFVKICLDVLFYVLSCTLTFQSFIQISTEMFLNRQVGYSCPEGQNTRTFAKTQRKYRQNTRHFGRRDDISLLHKIHNISQNIISQSRATLGKCNILENSTTLGRRKDTKHNAIKQNIITLGKHTYIWKTQPSRKLNNDSKVQGHFGKHSAIKQNTMTFQKNTKSFPRFCCVFPKCCYVL